MPSPSPHRVAEPRSHDQSISKPPMMKRHSSQSSHTSKQGVLSPGSAGEHQHLRHTVKPARRTKIVLPRNHSSARDLTKLARHTQNNNNLVAEDGRRGSRQRSHEGDTQIRLPGSLETEKPPPMRRNLTASQLPRNTSHTKLKKNLSHGHLTRLGSGKNLAALGSTSTKGPPSPGAKSRSKRPKSADLDAAEKDLHQQEVELAQAQQDRKDQPKKVGFAVGSSGDTSEEDAPAMEGSGLQEDEWTDQSASASPFSTRQNTANNSRRASVNGDKPPDKRALSDAASARHPLHHAQHHEPEPAPEADGTPAQSYESGDDDETTDEEVDEDDALSPRTAPQPDMKTEIEPLPQSAQQPAESKQPPRSPLHAAKDHPNPATRHLLSRGNHNPAPALVSNVSALDDTRSARGSPAPSIRSSRSNIGDSTVDPDPEQDQDELVSRFIPSASHPSTASGVNTTMNTPKTGSLHTPENESTLAAQNLDNSRNGFQIGPVSPVSTVSGSSGAATPATASSRSRMELRLMNEKAVAEMEDANARNPVIPAHVFDRRNESLKSYLNLERLGGDGRGGLSANTGIVLGPEIFQGRFKAVNTELKVVQKFRDPIAESLSRLHGCKDVKFAQLRGQKAAPQKQAARVPISRSSITLPKQGSKLSTSTSPPNSASPVKPAMTTAKSASQINRGTESRRSKVTFSQTPPETHEVERNEDLGADVNAIARQLWDSIG